MSKVRKRLKNSAMSRGRQVVVDRRDDAYRKRMRDFLPHRVPPASVLDSLLPTEMTLEWEEGGAGQGRGRGREGKGRV